MNTKKELRAKKVEYNFKVSGHNDEVERQKSISEIMDKHQKIHENISSHLKKELNTAIKTIRTNAPTKQSMTSTSNLTFTANKQL